MAGYGLADLLGGAALVEAVMNLQGLGLLLLNAVRSLDVPLVMGSVLTGTVLLLLGNLLADFALVAVDPRVDFATLASPSPPCPPPPSSIPPPRRPASSPLP